MRLLLTLLWLFSCIDARAGELVAPSFLDRVSKANSVYAGFAGAEAQKAKQLAGRNSEVNDALVALVPDARKTVADYFVLGNMLFREDRERSAALMKQAEKLLPDEPAIQFERGMHEHRQRNYAAAARYYERVAAGDSNAAKNFRVWAYLTHCYLMLGRYDDAKAAWPKADFRHNHSGIEEAMYDIFSDRMPAHERELALTQATTGDADGWCRAMELDRAWETNWWNVDTRSDYLEADRSAAIRATKADSPERRVVELCSNDAELGDKEWLAAVERAGYWGKGASAPPYPRLAYVIVRELEKRSLARPDEILGAYGKALEARLAAHPDDRDTVELLGHLYAATKRADDLQRVDQHGWKKLGIPAFAASYLVGLGPQGDGYAAAVKAAAEQFPDDATVAMRNLVLHDNAVDRKTYVMRFVAARFASVGYPSDYRLSDYMASLVKEVESREAAEAY